MIPWIHKVLRVYIYLLCPNMRVSTLPSGVIAYNTSPGSEMVERLACTSMHPAVWSVQESGGKWCMAS